MANNYAQIIDKKFFDGNGGKKLWKLIRARYDSKLDNVVASDDSIAITGDNGIAVKVSTETGNRLQLKTTGNKGLFVAPETAQDTYTVTKLGTPETGYAASYKLQKLAGGTGSPVDIAGAAVINIPKDMVVESGTVEEKSTSGAWGEPGTYLHLVLANAESSDIYINVGDLIEYVTSGSQAGDMVVISIDAQHKVTATITDGTVTKAKLAQAVQDSLDAADSAVQSVTAGDGNGQIKVDGTNVNVTGLKSAAYQESTAFDAAGAAADVLGTDSDAASAATVYGVKKYASDAYEAIKALTDAEIEALIAAADTEYEAG